MASFIKRGETWFAKIRVWDGARGEFVARRVSTHCRDRASAEGVARQLELAAGEASRGLLSRARAVELVDLVLGAAGLTSLGAGAEGMGILSAARARVAGAKVATARQYGVYLGAWESFWGSRGDRALGAWDGADFGKYYGALRGRMSAATANLHMAFWRATYAWGMKYGGYEGKNKAAAVPLQVGRKQVHRVGFTRGEVARVLRCMRGKKAWDWVALTALGWHTGHRLMDLAGLRGENVEFDQAAGCWVVAFTPAKKAGRGGRLVRLPVPVWLAGLLRRLGRLQLPTGASAAFGVWLANSGVGQGEAVATEGRRLLHTKSFHGFRHGMASRLVAAGVSGPVARLVTDHENEATHKGYVHAEVLALKVALDAARRLK